MLLDFSAIVPDGIICYFPSFSLLEKVVKLWQESKLLEALRANKLVYFESLNKKITQKSIQQYIESCDMGRGGIFLASARDKIQQSDLFESFYSRMVIVFGLPIERRFRDHTVLNVSFFPFIPRNVLITTRNTLPLTNAFSLSSTL